VKNISFIVITYDPSFNAFLMLTIDQFLTIVRLPLGSRGFADALSNRSTILPTSQQPQGGSRSCG
jgi:hypothetical protein